MKVNELRVGNLVWLKSKSKVWEILSGCEIDNGCDSEDFEPLSLLELSDWLVKFGFRLENKILVVYKKFINNSNTDFILVKLREVGSNPVWTISTYRSNTICPFSTEIKFVHQLQNFCFSVEGEELVLQD
jgi:hypothetical protein